MESAPRESHAVRLGMSGLFSRMCQADPSVTPPHRLKSIRKSPKNTQGAERLGLQDGFYSKTRTHREVVRTGIYQYTPMPEINQPRA